jgi:ATP-dependent DNA ligase
LLLGLEAMTRSSARTRCASKGRSGDSRPWLLIKEKDEAARRSSRIVEASPRSVASGRTLEEVAADPSSVWSSSRGKPDTDPARAPEARRAALPAFVRPQLATRVHEPPEGEAWLHETKFDGYRLRSAPLDARKALLKATLGPATGPLRYSEHVIGSGRKFFAEACRKGLEGIVSKRRDAS